MARNKHPSMKKRLLKRGSQTHWAPFWTVLKAFGKGKKVHPSTLTHVKRSWRRTNIKL